MMKRAAQYGVTWECDHPTHLEQTNSAYKAWAQELQEGSSFLQSGCNY